MTAKKTKAAKAKPAKAKRPAAPKATEAKPDLPRKKKPVSAHVKYAADRAEARARGEDPDAVEEARDKKATNPTKSGRKSTRKKGADTGPPAAEIAAYMAERERDAYEPKILGRPPKYKPEYALVARVLCKRGATDFEIAQELGVSDRTVSRWKVAHDDFCQALKIHKGDFDAQIERSLALRANGFTMEVEKVFHAQGRITRAKVLEYFPPDVAAAKMWLTNRKPEEWRDKTQTELTGKDGGAIEVVSAARQRVAERIADLKKKGRVEK